MSGDPRGAFERVADRFDFGEYELEAYLAILEHGDATAAEIAEHSDIPRPRVYDTVRDLAEGGLVELRESRPMRAVAIDPEEAFADLRSSIDGLVDQLGDTYAQPARSAEAAWLVKSRSTILRHLEDVIDAAEYELLVAVDVDLFERFESALRDRRGAGVAVDLLLSPAAEVPGGGEYDYPAVATSVRKRRGITTPVAAVADGTYSVYATREAVHGDSDRYGVVFDRSELGFLVSGFLNTVLWTTAEGVTAGDGGRSFPRRYATIRRCIADLEALEGTVYASVAGRDVVTGRRRTVEGQISRAALSESRETATLEIETGNGTVPVGGQVAAFEEIEAHEIRIDPDGPPGV